MEPRLAESAEAAAMGPISPGPTENSQLTAQRNPAATTKAANCSRV